jgi:rare lipoprotein A (peptidoglycan hydrolase)
MSKFNINNTNPSQRLLDPFVKVTVGKLGSRGAHIFTSGDGRLKNLSVTLGEGRNLSNCSFSIYDPNKRFTDAYFIYADLIGGLEGLETPQTSTQTAQNTPNNNPLDNNETVNTTPGKVIYENAQASTYGWGSVYDGGDTGAYGDKIPFEGMYAAMVNTKYKYAKMRVTNLANGKSVVVKVIDRGPFAIASNGSVIRPLREHPTRKIDLVRGAWRELTNNAPPGIINVKVEWIEAETTNANSSNQNKSKQQNITDQARLAKSQAASINQSNLTPQNKASLSVSKSKSPDPEKAIRFVSKAGTQITVELGFGGETIAAYSFIHTGLRFSLFEPDTLEFTGQAASWVLTQRVKNTVYTNITLKKIAQKITSSYGMKLEMPEEGPKYEYFPQRGQTDYEALLIEARRIGYRVYTRGSTLYIQPRKSPEFSPLINNEPIKEDTFFALEYGDNLGVFFEVSHQATTDTSGGARSAFPGLRTSTGERKFEIDPISGQVKQKRKENIVGTGSSQDAMITGSPLPLPAPITTGSTDAIDSQRKADEGRIKGIVANAEFPTTPEALTLDPDTPFKTQGLSIALNRFWVVDTLTHSYSAGRLTTKVTCYSPMKNKRPTADISEVKSPNNPSNNTSTFNPNAPKFIRPMTVGIVTSRHRSENPRRPNHKGIDISSVGGTGPGANVIASAAGTVVFAGFGANSNQRNGYGNVVDIDHGGGWMTRYAHLHSINVSVGQQVSQGQLIGIEGNTGFSFGTHLHTEIRLNGKDLNPLKFYKP